MYDNFNIHPLVVAIIFLDTWKNEQIQHFRILRWPCIYQRVHFYVYRNLRRRADRSISRFAAERDARYRNRVWPCDRAHGGGKASLSRISTCTVICAADVFTHSRHDACTFSKRCSKRCCNYHPRDTREILKTHCRCVNENRLLNIRCDACSCWK